MIFCNCQPISPYLPIAKKGEKNKVCNVGTLPPTLHTCLFWVKIVISNIAQIYTNSTFMPDTEEASINNESYCFTFFPTISPSVASSFVRF